MKSFAATLLLASGVLAARSTPIRARQTAGQTILPSLLSSHDVNAGDNVFALNTNTARNGAIETSTLYSVTFPASTAGLTCSATFFAGRAADSIVGTGQMDFFSTGITDLAAQASGNLRDAPQGRVTFAGLGQPFVFDPSVPAPFQYFPCPAGKTVVFESVAAGEFTVITVGQDTVLTGSGTPNGLSFSAY